MKPAMLAAYDRAVPRCTSCPTAAQFDASVDVTQQAEWLRDLGGIAALLCLHVPFCQELCWYCAYHTMAMRRPRTLDAYADALAGELLRIRQAARGPVLDAVQWGGGTPGQLEAAVASIDRLSAPERDRLIVKNDGRLDVTEDGRPLLRFVCAAFDRHFNGAAGQHSRGI